MRNNPGDFFASTIEKFDRVFLSSQDSLDLFYDIAGHVVRIKFVNPRMADALIPAIQHLRIDSRPGEQLTVCCCDGACVGSDLPHPGWSAKNNATSGDTRLYKYNDERFSLVFFARSGTLSLLDKERNLAIFYAADYDKLPSYERSAPLRYVFQMSMGGHGKQLIHGAAVGFADGGVLLVGRGRSGKSTAALACLGSDLCYGADDYCLVSGGDAPRFFSVYSSALLNGEDVDKFAALKPALGSRDALSDRAVYFLTKMFKHKMINSFSLKAILIAHISGLPGTTLRSASSLEAIRAFAFSTILQFPTDGQRVLGTIGDIAKKVPCYVIELGTERTKIPAPIIELLSSAGGGSREVAGNEPQRAPC